jgi:signal transduction histidine kinase
MKTIGQALSGVIHDFRSPMAVIAGYTELIAIEDNANKRKDMAEAVTGQVQHMNSMVGELLAFARGETAIYKRKVYMNKFADDLKALFSTESATRSIELSVYSRYDGAANFDPVKIKRVITNLVRNAIESTEAPGGKVSLTIEADGNALVMSVRDNGKGIPEEIEGRLFEHFVTAGKAGGTGLGLAVCKRIVEDHGGTISAQSRPGRGAVFTFNLPNSVLS